MIEFHLFRIKLQLPRQLSLFGEGALTPSQSLYNTVIQIVSNDIEDNQQRNWVIGNIEEIDTSGLYFRVGKIKESARQYYENGRFLEEITQDSPSTHSFLDWKLELCAIAKKSKLAPNPKLTANRLMNILNNSKYAQDNFLNFEADSIRDPEDFLNILNRAYSITTFWTTLSPPNAWDVDNQFIKPNQEFIRRANGNSGRVSIKGEGLNPGPLQEVVRSTAATGNDSGASIILSPESNKTINKKMSSNPVLLNKEDVSSEEDKKLLMEMVRERYKQIRGGDDDGGSEKN